MRQLGKLYQFWLGVGLFLLALLLGWSLPMIIPSTPYNGILITIFGVIISAPFFIWAYILYRRQQKNNKEQVLTKPLNIFFDKEDPCCYKYDIDGNTHEQFFRLGITNPNSLPVKNTEVILTKCLRDDVEHSVRIPIAPSRLKPFGLADDDGLFEIDANARYINIAYMNTNFDDEGIKIPFLHYEQGNVSYIPFPFQDGRYKLELLVRGSNIKTTKHTIYLERPSEYWELRVKVGD